MDAWHVADGFEPVRTMFQAGAARAFGRGGGGYTAYLDGSPVLDLWAGQARPGEPWSRGTSTVIMSATKGLAAFCVQLLEDRGQVDVDARVADVWPEFAQNGKQDVTLRQVLTHTAGLLGFAGQRGLLHWDGTGWDDHEAIAAGLAAAPLSWPAGTQHAYHALSVGWLLGEVVRRVSGRSIGTFFAEEVAGPLGVEAWLGTPDSELGRVARLHKASTDRLPRPLRNGLAAAVAVARDPDTLTGLTFLGSGTTSAVEELEGLFNNPKVLAAELPFGGATATARGLARLWAVLACGGELDGVRVLSAESVERWSRVEICEPDLLMKEVAMPKLLSSDAGVPRTLGYLGNGGAGGLPQRFGPVPEAYGAEGLGGQFAFADRANRISVGYVRSDCAPMDLFQGRLTQELYRCAERLGMLRSAPPSPSRGKRLVQRALVGYLEPRMVPAPSS